MIDPVCLIHGKKKSEHVCLYCCLCFKSLTLEECNINKEGHREDVCVECAEEERKHMTNKELVGILGAKPLVEEPAELTQYDKVKTWMAGFGQETPAKPCIPSLEVRKLRAKLILEEAIEVVNALGFKVYLEGYLTINNLELDEDLKPNFELVADGCADLKFVTLGTEVACGLSRSEEIFAEVCRSNNSKLWTNKEVANHMNKIVIPYDENFYHPLSKYSFTRVSVGLRDWLVKDANGKVIKSPSYSPYSILRS